MVQVTEVESRSEDGSSDYPPLEVGDADGADRRWAEWFRWTPPPRRRTAIIVLAASLLSAVIAAVDFSSGGSSHRSTATTGTPAVANGAESNGSTGVVFGPANGGGSTAGTSGDVGAASSSGSPALPNEVPSFTQKVVQTGTLQIEVTAGSVDGTVTQLSLDAKRLSGFVASTSESTGTTASGALTLRIPAASYETLIVDAQKLGKTLQLTSSGQDVTNQYVDLQARIQSLQDTRTQFEQILAKAQAIGDILSVESQISDVQTQIEQLQGQFQVLDDQATYSTLTVQINEAGRPLPAPAKPAGGISKAWSHARHSFTRGAESILGATGGIALFLITLGGVLLIGRFVWAVVRRRVV